MSDIDNSAGDLTSMYQLLCEDVIQALKDLDAGDTPYLRRVLVRAVFAAVEGTIYLIKQKTLGRPDLHAFSDAEVALLREESYTLNSKGEPVIQAKFLPVDQNFRFAMEMFMRRTLPEFKMELTDEGWAAFKQAIQIRHRITHPKQLARLNVSDDELRTIRVAYHWFYRTVVLGLLDTVDHLRARVKEMRLLVTNCESQDNSGH